MPPVSAPRAKSRRARITGRDAGPRTAQAPSAPAPNSSAACAAPRPMAWSGPASPRASPPSGLRLAVPRRGGRDGPARGPAYAAVGLTVNPTGLDFEAITAKVAASDPGKVLVSGALRNVRDNERTAPPVRVALLDAHGSRDRPRGGPHRRRPCPAGQGAGLRRRHRRSGRARSGHRRRFRAGCPAAKASLTRRGRRPRSTSAPTAGRRRARGRRMNRVQGRCMRPSAGACATRPLSPESARRGLPMDMQPIDAVAGGGHRMGSRRYPPRMADSSHDAHRPAARSRGSAHRRRPGGADRPRHR
jgi:hypothetical protein